MHLWIGSQSQRLAQRGDLRIEQHHALTLGAPALQVGLREVVAGDRDRATGQQRSDGLLRQTKAAAMAERMTTSLSE